MSNATFSAQPDCVPTYINDITQQIFYDESGIGGTICQNIDPSYLTAEEREKMAELRRSKGIPEPKRDPEVLPRCDSPILEEVPVVPVPEEVYQGYDPEALVKVKNLIELEQINTAIGGESTALRVNNREQSRYIEQLKMNYEKMQQFHVNQLAYDMAAKDAEIERQESAKKRAQENLAAEKKKNELFVAQNVKEMHNDHLQYFYHMLTTEMKSRGMHILTMEPTSSNMCSIQTLTPTSQLSCRTTPDVGAQKPALHSIDAILKANWNLDKSTVFDDTALQGPSQSTNVVQAVDVGSGEALSGLLNIVSNYPGPTPIPPMSKKPRAPRKPRAKETKPRAPRRSKESRPEFSSKRARNPSFNAVEEVHEEQAKKWYQTLGIKL